MEACRHALFIRFPACAGQTGDDSNDILEIALRFRSAPFDQVDNDRRRLLDPEDLKDWLDTYSLSEAWEKNVLGGTP